MDKKTQHILGKINQSVPEHIKKRLYNSQRVGDMREVLDLASKQKGVTAEQRKKFARMAQHPSAAGKEEMVIDQRASAEYNAYVGAQVSEAIKKGKIQKADPNYLRKIQGK